MNNTVFSSWVATITLLLMTCNNAFGATSANWKLIIQPQFSEASSFSEGLAAVRVGDRATGKWGYIDRQGALVINPQFDYASDFVSGLANVRIGDAETGRYGFIDKQGTYVIAPRLLDASSFHEGAAVGAVANGKKPKMPERTDGGGPDAELRFREKVLDNWLSNDMKYGYVNKAGVFIISANFYDARDFSEGLAAVFVGEPKNGKWGFIDSKGKMIIAARFDDVGELIRRGSDLLSKQSVNYRGFSTGNFSEGLVGVQFGSPEAGKWGFIDKRGVIVIEPQFGRVGTFKEGIARVLLGDDETGEWGFIDKRGKRMGSPPISIVGRLGDFSDGLAVIRIGSGATALHGYLNKEGRVAINPRFCSGRDFSEELAAVCLEDRGVKKWGFIDKTGGVVIDYQFSQAESFSEGLAAVRFGDEKAGQWGYLGR